MMITATRATPLETCRIFVIGSSPSYRIEQSKTTVGLFQEVGILICRVRIAVDPFAVGRTHSVLVQIDGLDPPGHFGGELIPLLSPGFIEIIGRVGTNEIQEAKGADRSSC